MVTKLTDRLARLEQQNARLAEAKAATMVQLRKRETRRRIEVGRLAEKAGLLDMPDPAALRGAILSLQSGSTDPKTVERWIKAGREDIAREIAERGKRKEPLTITFRAAIPQQVASSLRAAGFRWVRVLQQWVGEAELTEAEALAAAAGGRVDRVNNRAPDMPLAAE